MSLPRNAVRTTTTPVLSAAALVLSLSSAAFAGQEFAGQELAGQNTANRILPASSHCTDFGPGFVDMGNGTCGRPSTHIRVGTRNANASAWTIDGTSTAGLRSDSHGMVPGASDATHLRVRSGLDPLSLFR